jgi:hypothetical protein
MQHFQLVPNIAVDGDEFTSGFPVFWVWTGSLRRKPRPTSGITKRAC